MLRFGADRRADGLPGGTVGLIFSKWDYKSFTGLDQGVIILKATRGGAVR